MEEIRKAIAGHGNVWSLKTNNDMNALYEPLHANQKEQFVGKVNVEKGIKYGDHPRHRLDVYTPVSGVESMSTALPVVVFFHGGTSIPKTLERKSRR